MHFPVNMNVSVWRLAALTLAFALYLVTPCSADLVDDLQPLDGYVVMARDNEFIIDLDSQDGVAVGDREQDTPGRGSSQPQIRFKGSR